MIEYIFQIDNGETLHFRIELDRQHDDKNPNRKNRLWTELNYSQCGVCSLPPDEYLYCPAAVDLQEIIEKFSTFFSYDTVLVRVKVPEREYSKTCDIQTGLQSLLGLSMATSACPILSRLRPLANFHLPFATPEDTIFRTVGAYLIQQYFILSDNGDPDFHLKKLEHLYTDLEDLNTAFSKRVEIASKTDANLGAIVQLGALSFLIQESLKEQLKDFRVTFQKKIGKG